MKKSLILLVSALSLLVAHADGDQPAAPEKLKKPSVTLKLTQYPLISKNVGDSNDSGNRWNQSRSKTSTYQMKWDCSVRVRERVPEGLKLEVYYIGQDAENQWVQIGETVVNDLTLDDKGTWKDELLSPTTTWTETKQKASRNFNNSNNDDTPKKQGERIKGCIVRVVGEGQIWKSFTSDPRWAKIAKKDSFSIDELNTKNSRIGSK